MYIEYRSVDDLSRVLLKNLYKFPHNIDLVVGIPRSGMLTASLLALYLNKPLADIDSFVNGHIYTYGNRGKFIDTHSSDSKEHILIIDDTVSSGRAIKMAKDKLAIINREIIVTYATVYTSSKGKKEIDVYCEIINGPRIFQWNLFHEVNLMKNTCMDIDGVLCPNPPVDDDGIEYVNYITNAKPLITPTVEINTLITCRLEKYREITEKWLLRNGIKYKNLIMLNFPTKTDRIKWGKHGEFKGNYYRKSTCNLFVESSLNEAREICKLSGKQVYCVDTLQMLYGENIFLDKIETKTIHQLKSIFKSILPNSMQTRLKKIIRKD